MKKYAAFFRIRFLTGLQYRASALAGIITQVFWGIMELLLFRAFYRANPSAFPMEFEQLASYIWLQEAFLAMFMTWFLDNEIFSSITSGNIAYELARPMDIYNTWYVKNAVLRLSKAALRFLPVLIAAVCMPKPYRICAPRSVWAFLFFVLSMVLAFGVMIAFCMLIYISVVYTLSPMGVRMVAMSLTEFLSGSIIPLPFLPDKMRRIIELTPFAAMQNLPLRIYSGNIYGREMAVGILLQVFWLVVLVVFGKLWLRNGLRKTVIQGG